MSPSFSSSSLFSSESDINWDAGTLPILPSPTTTELMSPTVTNQLTFPPSPALSLENNIPLDEHATLKEFLRQSTDQFIMSLDYPFPLSPPLFESPQTPNRAPSIDSTEPILRRRGRGRPSKAQRAREESELHQTTKNAITIRRRVHNNNAMRSRARVNTLLDELWDEVPEKERLIHPLKSLCRTEKVDIVRNYVRKLQKLCG